MNTTSNWEERFADKFVTRGLFGERRLTRIFVNKLTPNDRVPLDEQVIAELEAFIQEEKDKSYREGFNDFQEKCVQCTGLREEFKENLRDKVEKMKKEIDREFWMRQINREGMARQEGYNQAIEDVLSLPSLNPKK